MSTASKSPRKVAAVDMLGYVGPESDEDDNGEDQDGGEDETDKQDDVDCSSDKQ